MQLQVRPRSRSATLSSRRGSLPSVSRSVSTRSASSRRSASQALRAAPLAEWQAFYRAANLQFILSSGQQRTVTAEDARLIAANFVGRSVAQVHPQCAAVQFLAGRSVAQLRESVCRHGLPHFALVFANVVDPVAPFVPPEAGGEVEEGTSGSRRSSAASSVVSVSLRRSSGAGGSGGAAAVAEAVPPPPSRLGRLWTVPEGASESGTESRSLSRTASAGRSPSPRHRLSVDSEATNFTFSRTASPDPPDDVVPGETPFVVKGPSLHEYAAPPVMLGRTRSGTATGPAPRFLLGAVGSSSEDSKADPTPTLSTLTTRGRGWSTDSTSASRSRASLIERCATPQHQYGNLWNSTSSFQHLVSGSIEEDLISRCANALHMANFSQDLQLIF